MKQNMRKRTPLAVLLALCLAMQLCVPAAMASNRLMCAGDAAIAQIEQRLEEAGGDYERYSEIYKEKEAAEQKLSELMEKWETLAEQVGE